MSSQIKSAILNNGLYEKNIHSLVEKYSLPLVNDLTTAEFTLYFSDHHLYLHWQKNPQLKNFRIDYLQKTFAGRLKKLNAQREMLARACQMKKHTYLTVLDVTAGLGFDAVILAHSGFQVTAIEREPVLAALLEQAFSQISMQPKLVFADSADYLKNLPTSNCPDIIYLDPIFPEKFKAARSNKYLYLLQHLCEKNENEEELFNLALKRARYRVVVKRPIHAPFIKNQKPNFSLKGKSHRLDIYAFCT